MKIPVLLAVITLSVFVPTMGLAQSLESGAVLSIQSTDGSLNLAVYDSQIHSGISHSFPCDNGLVTDAYVVQGGSASGCDPGDSYETSQAPGAFKFVGTGYEFDVTTFYTETPGTCNSPGNTGPIEPICVNPDSGFLTVTNNGSSNFTGTITLSGNSPLAGPPYCAPNGMASEFHRHSYSRTIQNLRLSSGREQLRWIQRPADPNLDCRVNRYLPCRH